MQRVFSWKNAYFNEYFNFFKKKNRDIVDVVGKDKEEVVAWWLKSGIFDLKLTFEPLQRTILHEAIHFQKGLTKFFCF